MTDKNDFELLGHVYAIPYPKNIDKTDKFVDRVCNLKGVESIGDAMGARDFMILEIDTEGIKTDVLSKIARLYKIYDK